MTIKELLIARQEIIDKKITNEEVTKKAKDIFDYNAIEKNIANEIHKIINK